MIIRGFFLFYAIAVAAAMPPAWAQTTGPVPDMRTKGASEASVQPSPQPETRAARLERLYDSLAGAASVLEARRFATTIENLRLRSGSATADLLTERATEAIQRKEVDQALTLLDAAVDAEPDFAEAWNRRATLLFQKGDYDRAMIALYETLQRDPRHWGAWAGLGRILEATGDKRRALAAYRRAIAAYPRLESVKDRAARLAVEIRGSEL